MSSVHNNTHIIHIQKYTPRQNSWDAPFARKTANPHAFPPDFVRDRLELFHLESSDGSEWVKMHRGYSIYKDYLADYYRVIHEEFVLNYMVISL